MTRSQWVCRSDRAEFGTRGKRDIYHRKEHQKIAQNMMSGNLGSRARCSNDGTFSYTCEKCYGEVQSLIRHRRTCTEWNLIQQPESCDEEYGFTLDAWIW